MINYLSTVSAGVFLAFAVVSSSFIPATATAQAFMRIEDTKTNANTYYYYTHNPGSATVRVHVLGAVRLPGVYEISESTDLGH